MKTKAIVPVICAIGAVVLLSALLLAKNPAARAAAVGEKFRDCPVCPELTVVPAGSFVMGRNGPYDNEGPAHRVTIAQPFAIGVYEVTFDEWQACFDAGGCAFEPDDHKWGRGRRPVININWRDAQTYLQWLSGKTGNRYRLPSEAEWEYAARAGTTTDYWWGDQIGENLGNCRDCKSRWSKRSSAPVGSFRPNPFGLYDVHGNIWEMTQDCWNKTHQGAPADAAARLTGDCRYRVMRSGSWYYFSKNLRSSWRFRDDARVKSYGIGFRVLRELP